MDVSISVLAVIVDDAFSIEGSVLLQRFVRPEAVGIDGQRLLLAVSHQESDRGFVCGLRWHHVVVVASPVN